MDLRPPLRRDEGERLAIIEMQRRTVRKLRKLAQALGVDPTKLVE
jgi:hypothetical protein